MGQNIEAFGSMLTCLVCCHVCRFPALAKLPESSNPEEAFALTRVVSGQDTHNYVLVAHEAVPMAQLAAAPAAGDEKSPARLVGFMVITSEVDTSALLDTFDLHPYDNFLPAEEYDKQYEQARESMRTKKVSTPEGWLWGIPMQGSIDLGNWWVSASDRARFGAAVWGHSGRLTTRYELGCHSTQCVVVVVLVCRPTHSWPS